MPVSICPRCKHVNPEYATYCHFDGVVLQAQQSAAAHRLPSEFVFPTGRRCATFDQLAQGCQEEWTAARDLLMRGVFVQFFRACKREDLVRAANDAKAIPNPDIALMTFLNSLPGTRTQTPKLDLNPRRILLGAISVGEVKTIPLTITNQGQGMLQGTIAVTEGQDWLSLSETAPLHEVEVAAVREQVIRLTIKPKGIAAGQTYGARLTVVTNGGVVEVPLRMELTAQPFPKSPFQGVQSGRDLADKMRQHPKAAVPILESGEVQRWYALNGWTYPVIGVPVKGVAGVQQFFEGLGVSKPPPLALSLPEFRLRCKYGDKVRGQVTLQAGTKKWVYAQIKSDSTWLKPAETSITGPQHATAHFEIDTNHWPLGPTGEGKLTFEANGGQKLTLKVVVEVQGAPAITRPKPPMPAPPPVAPRTPPMPTPIAAGPPPMFPAADVTTPSISMSRSVKFVPALLTTLLLCLVLRIVLVPFVDCLGRSSVARSAAQKLGIPPAQDGAINETGGWLMLPWLPILAGGGGSFPAKDFQPQSAADINMLEFRHYFVSYFIRWFVLCTFWIGAIFGAVLVLRRGGGVLDIPWGIIAGTVAGFAFSATLAAFFLVAEMIPHTLWHLTFGGHTGAGYLVLWIVLAIISWFIVGIGLGIVLPWVGPLRRLLIDPFQSLVAGAFRTVGLGALAEYWAP